MIKQKLPGLSDKEILEARALNRIHTFMLMDGQIRGAVVHGTHMIREMRQAHNLGILETLLLGHAYLGGALMTANLKGAGRLLFKIECSGPIQGLAVEVTGHGEVRGYLKNNPIPLEEPPVRFDLSPYFGEGFLQVIHYPEAAKQPYEGRVNLQHGSIALNLANYYRTSEQTPSAFNLSIRFDPDGKIIGAGGIFLQVMPEADEKLVAEIEEAVANLPSIGEKFARDTGAEDFVNSHFHSAAPKFLAHRRVEFFCQCRKESLENVLIKLPEKTFGDIRKNGPFPVEIHCNNCNTLYKFDKNEIEEMAGKR